VVLAVLAALAVVVTAREVLARQVAVAGLAEALEDVAVQQAVVVAAPQVCF
jgi:hypothetical protein